MNIEVAAAPMVYDNIVVGEDGVGYMWTFKGKVFQSFYILISYYFLSYLSSRQTVIQKWE